MAVGIGAVVTVGVGVGVGVAVAVGVGIGVGVAVAVGIAVGDGIWFGHTDPLPERVLIAFRLDVNEWRGERRVQFLLEGAQTNG